MAAIARPELWIGSRWCLDVIRADYSVDRVGGYEGLPVGNVTALVAGAEPGTLWIGSTQGLALRCETCDDTWRFFAGDRWLAGGSSIVTVGLGAPAPAPAPSSSTTAETKTKQAQAGEMAGLTLPAVWAATADGLSCVSAQPITLEEKANKMTARLQALDRHRWARVRVCGAWRAFVRGHDAWTRRVDTTS